MGCRDAVCALIWLSALCLWPMDGRAVVLPAQDVPRLLNADVPVLPNGVLIFAHDPGSGFPQQEAVTVIDARGALVAGELESPAVGGQPLSTNRPGLWIWRPLVPFEPSAHYMVRSINPSTSERRETTFETAAEPGAIALGPDQLTASLFARSADVAEAAECCERDDDYPPNCFAPSFLPAPGVHVTIDPLDPDAALRQMLFAVPSHDGDGFGALTFHAFGQRLPDIPFARQADEYCADIELHDAISQTRLPPSRVCVDNDPSLFDDEDDAIPKTPEQLAGALVALGCNEPPQGFEEAWCIVNQGHCFSRSSLGCGHFDELCPDYPREPARDGGAAQSAGGADAEPQAGEGTPPRAGGDSAGCGVVRAGGPSRAVLSALAMIAVVSCRRRRAIRS